jgi:hypothetical protein
LRKGEGLERRIKRIKRIKRRERERKTAVNN